MPHTEDRDGKTYPISVTIVLKYHMGNWTLMQGLKMHEICTLFISLNMHEYSQHITMLLRLYAKYISGNIRKTKEFLNSPSKIFLNTKYIKNTLAFMTNIIISKHITITDTKYLTQQNVVITKHTFSCTKSVIDSLCGLFLVIHDYSTIQFKKTSHYPLTFTSVLSSQHKKHDTLSNLY